MQGSLNLISISKPVNIYFVMLQCFLKPEILNSLKNSITLDGLLYCPRAHFYVVVSDWQRYCLSGGRCCTSAQAREFISAQMRRGWAPGTDGQAGLSPRAPVLPLCGHLLSPRASFSCLHLSRFKFRCRQSPQGPLGPQTATYGLEATSWGC